MKPYLSANQLHDIPPAINGNVWVRRILISLVFAYTCLLLLSPIFAIVTKAFQGGFGSVLSVLIQPEVLSSFLRTIWISIIVVIVHAIFGTIVAWVIVRHRFSGKKILNGSINIPFVISPVVVGYILLLLFGRHGKFAPFLDFLKIKVAFAFPGMVLATMFVTLPFMIRELIPVLESFDIQQEQAAFTLGASNWQAFWKVTMPSIKWGFFYGLVLTFARALGEFGAVLVIGGSIQGQTETTTLFIYRALDERQSIAAYSVSLVLGFLSMGLVTGIHLFYKKKP